MNHLCAKARTAGLAVVLAAGPAWAGGVSGTISDTGGNPAKGVFLLLTSPGFAAKQFTTTGADGGFALSAAAKDDFIILQPPTKENDRGLAVFSLQPRIYRMGDGTAAALRLPPAGGLVLKGYDDSGKLMRYEDYTRRGTFAGQFAYVTDLDDRMRPPACWWIHDKESGGFGAKKEKGLPAFALEPGAKYVLHVLYWEVPAYGKLMLRADNAGQGFFVSAPGECLVVEVAVELARTAVADLVRRGVSYASEALARIAGIGARLADAGKLPDEPARAAAASGILSEALKLRDDLEYEAAKAAIPGLRKGTVRIRVQDAKGAPAAACKLRIKQTSHDFLFGVCEGSPYNAAAYEQARQAGFELATVLLGWNWTGPQGGDWSAVDKTFGLSALKKLGYRVKAHGVIYLQDYGIMPDKALRMDKKELPVAILDHQKTLIASAIGKQIDLWEVMNEPGAANIVHLPRPDVLAMIRTAAQNIRELSGKPALINSAHEINFGAKYTLYGMDNEPIDAYSVTYADFLQQANDAGALDDVDLIGLEVYPGTHLSRMFGGIEGPAFTPSWLLDVIERYARFGKPLHITEFSLPSTHDKDWNCGYWREPWNETTQADYADAVYTLAFGNPHVQSVTWWGVSALKPDVETSCLFDKDGKPKPVLERLQRRLAEWTTAATAETDPAGMAALDGFAGDYELTVTPANGRGVTQTIHVFERKSTPVTVTIEGAP
jgi:hypothetical protein